MALSKRLRIVLKIFAALVLLVAVAVSLLLYLASQGGNQIRSLIALQRYQKFLVEYAAANGGAYPEQLEVVYRPEEGFEGLDGWGNPILYLSDGSYYVLVSCGRDGKPDGLNYVALRNEPRLENPNCEDLDLDQVLTDQGWYRACGK